VHVAEETAWLEDQHCEDDDEAEGEAQVFCVGM